jgi:hypothetical protein
MRRKISIIGVLLLSLCVSGWSSALAAALACSHDKGARSHAMIVQDHSCCHARAAQEAQPHCTTPEREAMGDMQMMPAATVAVADNAAVANVQPAGSLCTHCMERSEFPATTNALQVNKIKRNVDAASSDTLHTLAPLVALFTPPVLSRQGSPPGARTRKHLLISLFLI